MRGRVGCWLAAQNPKWTGEVHDFQMAHDSKGVKLEVKVFDADGNGQVASGLISRPSMAWNNVAAQCQTPDLPAAMPRPHCSRT